MAEKSSSRPVEEVEAMATGWWFQPTPLQNHGQIVSDDEIPNCFWKVIVHPCSKPPSSYLINHY